MFKKVIEDFVCEKCGNFVKGNGFTNHCPKCLWSKHVDNDPGDRENNCKGMMEPIRIDSERHGEFIVFKCEKCGEQIRNKVSKDDDFSTVLQISKKFADKF